MIGTSDKKQPSESLSQQHVSPHVSLMPNTGQDVSPGVVAALTTPAPDVGAPSCNSRCTAHARANIERAYLVGHTAIE
jgi:hypothetical protein